MTLAELDAALRDPKRLPRMRAIRALGELGGPDAVSLLLRTHDDPDEKPVLRNLAMDALLQIGTPDVADALEARLNGYPSKRGRRVVAKRIAKLRQSL